MIRPTVVAALFAVTIAVGGSTHAEPSAADVTTAKSLVSEGRALRDKGKHSAARDRFKGAFALVPTPIIGMDLAREHLALGELVEAREVAIAVTKLPANPKESEEGRAARADAATVANDLTTRIPSLVIDVDNLPAGGTVLLDDVPVPPATFGVPRKLNPGKHTVVARVDEREKSRTVTLGEGQQKKVTIDAKELGGTTRLPATSAANEGSTATTTTSPGTAAQPDGARPVWPWIALGAGAVGLIGGIKFGLDWSSANADYRAQCPSTDCPQRDQLAQDRDRAAALTIVSGIIGVAGVTIGAIGLASSSGGSSKTTATLRVLPGGVLGSIAF